MNSFSLPLAIATVGCLSTSAQMIENSDSIIMGREADAFIAAMPSGLQRFQADAVEAAINGDSTMLEKVRSSRNTEPHYSGNVTVADIAINGNDGRIIPSRLYSPAGKSDMEPLPLMVYFHGGGWTFGSLNSCARFCDAVASTGKAIVLAVDYRLAPEHPFPCGLNDCIEAVGYAFSNAGELGSDSSLVSVGGDSSGGNLALATAMSLNSIGSMKIRSTVLFYPVVVANADNSVSWHKYGYGLGLDSDLMDSFNKAYIKGGNDSSNCLISPAYASDDELRNLPPTLIINAERDILASQGRDFAEKLSDAGVAAQHTVLPGTVHLFITVAGQETAFARSVEMTSSFLALP